VTEPPRGVAIRAVAQDERPWLAEHLELAWGGATVLSRGRAHDVSRLPAIVAVAGEELAGLATFEVTGRSCELVTLEAFREGQGIGSALLAAVTAAARDRGCERLWLVTTNDNLRALRFYQRRGLRLVAVDPGAVDLARAVKPQIPLVGQHGIAIHDALELALELAD
jgi:ribosomal protein S18 acetylase RimI-like enzyme